MLRKFILLTFCFAFLLTIPVSPSMADSDFSTANNKFGIGLAKPQDDDMKKAAELVNANGGDWGYVTLVMQENDLNKEQWQNTFDRMRELKLIPIIRLATQPEGGNWKRPSKEDADRWVEFLNSLHWVVKDRYIILFNEPNHATEWGGAVDANGYAEIAQVFAEKLRAKSSDFIVMPAGLDASAPSAEPRYADSGIFTAVMVNKIGKDKFNELFQAWSSHSYPNPAFAGSPTGSGKGSVRTYEWELNLLKELGVKELPVYITETGWDNDAIGRDRVGAYYVKTFSEIWLPDDRVKAVTPFILNYQGEPFLKFSWRRFESEDYYPQFEQVKQMGKIRGNPKVYELGNIKIDLPKYLVQDSNYHFVITLNNMGQGFWDKYHGYRLELEGVDKNSYLFADLYKIAPNDSREVDLYINTRLPAEKLEAAIFLYKYDEKVLQGPTWKYEVLPLPSLKFKAPFLTKRKTNSDKFEIQLFNEREELVYKKKNVKVKDAIGEIPTVRNIAFGRKYRIVVLHPYYLPRQTYVIFDKGGSNVVFERMLPFDFNNDGAFGFADVWAFITHPDLWKNIMP